MKPEESNNLLIWRVFIIFHMIPVVLLFCRMNSYAEDVVVIVNNNVPVDSLPREDIKKIFLGQKKMWKNNNEIHFVVQKNSSEVHHRFLEEYVGRTAFQYQNYWRKQLFTGRGKTPRSLDNDKIIEFVLKNNGSISYVSSEANIDGVKKIIVY